MRVFLRFTESCSPWLAFPDTGNSPPLGIFWGRQQDTHWKSNLTEDLFQKEFFVSHNPMKMTFSRKSVIWPHAHKFTVHLQQKINNYCRSSCPSLENLTWTFCEKIKTLKLKTETKENPKIRTNVRKTTFSEQFTAIFQSKNTETSSIFPTNSVSFAHLSADRMSFLAPRTTSENNTRVGWGQHKSGAIFNAASFWSPNAETLRR